MTPEHKPKANFTTLFREVECLRDTIRRELERHLAKKSEDDIAHFSCCCEYIADRYNTVANSLQKALGEDEINPSDIVLLQETLANDLCHNALQVLQKLETIYSQTTPFAAFFGGASRMTALGAALNFMQEVGSISYPNDWEGENAFKKRLRAGLKGCDSIRKLMWHLKRLDPKDDFPYGNIVVPFFS